MNDRSRIPLWAVDSLKQSYSFSDGVWSVAVQLDERTGLWYYEVGGPGICVVAHGKLATLAGAIGACNIAYNSRALTA